MPKRFRRFVERVLTLTSQQLALCCHRDVGNLPLEALRRNARGGRLR
jgi:hypothetical protein